MRATVEPRDNGIWELQYNHETMAHESYNRTMRQWHMGTTVLS